MLAIPYELDQDGAVVTATIGAAELPHTDMQELVTECVEKLRYDSARDFIFDLSKVEFIASACLGCLVELLQETEHCKGRILLANVSDSVAFLFKVTKLDSVFKIFDDVADAKEELA